MRKLSFLCLLTIPFFLSLEYAHATTIPIIPYVKSDIQLHLIEPLLKKIEKQKSPEIKLNIIYISIREYRRKQKKVQKEGMTELANYYSGIITTLSSKIHILKKPISSKKDQLLNIVCIGDSNTAATTGFIATKRYCDLLGSSHKNIDGLVTYNEGFTTLVTKDLIDRNQLHVFSHKIPNKRNIVTILIGTNDFYFKNTLDNTWNQMQILIANLKSEGWEVFIMTYPPRIGDSERNIYLRSLNTLIKNNSIGIGYTVVDIYPDFIDPVNLDNTKDGILLPDLLHFTELAHFMIYKKLESSLGLKTPDTYAITLLRKELLIPTLKI